jgi:DNA polymerase-3 subunit gamma/tau
MISLARKYRPTTLKDLLGQEALVTVIKAAISTKKLSQAYILTGVRGVGKTTTARIIARSINCEKGPTIEPCGTCRSCVEISSDASLDVFELDAASRNGVGDMRELIENISYAPMNRGARKIYIVDEAHMLSTPAWNALLKTLEEPPEHVMFIFATTEPRKIPATIQSRCQKFSLRRIDRDVIGAHLDSIAEQEGATLEAGVSQTIAQAGEGSMRDAISILDQAISGSGGETVSLDHVREMIGRATPKAMIDALAAIVSGKPAEAMNRWRSVITSGIDPIVALDDLMVLFHLICLAGYDLELLSDSGLSPEDGERLKRINAAFGVPKITAAQRMMFEARSIAAENPNRSQAVEILIMRLTHGFAKKS